MSLTNIKSLRTRYYDWIHIVEKGCLDLTILDVSDSDAVVATAFTIEAQKTMFLPFAEFELSLHHIESQGYSEVNKFLFVLRILNYTSSLRMRRWNR